MAGLRQSDNQDNYDSKYRVRPKEGRLAADIGLFGQKIHLGCAMQKFNDFLIPQRKSKRHQADHRGEAVPPADVIIHVKRAKVLIGIIHRTAFAGYGNAVMPRFDAISP